MGERGGAGVTDVGANMLFTSVEWSEGMDPPTSTCGCPLLFKVLLKFINMLHMFLAVHCLP